MDKKSYNKKVILNVSSSNKVNCIDIIKLLYKKKIEVTLTPTISVHCSKKNKKKCWIEKGCNVQLYNVNNKQIKSIWNEVHNKLDLYCAHIRIPNTSQDKFSGCIHRFLKNNK